MQLTKWEYQVTSVRGLELEKRLRHLGTQAWELASAESVDWVKDKKGNVIDRLWFLILKRPLEQSA